MLTVLNICILVTLLIMIAIWATYGFFSAFIHLILVIASGVLALALWEPTTYILLGRMPAYAHGVGLLAPFAIILIVLRVVFDKLCKANLHMPHFADQIGGGVCGLCSGVLAFGMVLNGANFMPVQRGIMGWEPYKVKGNEVNENPDGQLWGFTRINEWSAGFFDMLSTGSMSPTGGTPLAEGRPNLAKRALLTRLPADEFQLRTAQPESVDVTGVYAIPATEEAVRGLVRRAAILVFLNPAYEVSDDVEYGESGDGLVDTILNDLVNRVTDSETHGKASAILNIQAIMDVARTPEFAFEGAANPTKFPEFFQMVADKLGSEQVRRLKPVLGEGKVLYVVDTFWNNDHPGAFNTDAKLRVAVSQVSLGVDGQTVAPIGYSIEYSQNTGGRIFTEIISDDADVAMTNMAYSKYEKLHMGWIFALSEGQQPDRFFVRELRFDLNKLEKPAGSETKVNQNAGAVARVVGAPLLPSPEDLTEKNANSAAGPVATGVKIAGTNSYVDVSEQLPLRFSASALSWDFDKSSDPWLLRRGMGERVKSGSGGSKSSVNEIWVQPSDRLVRVKLDGQGAKSLYGRAIQLAEQLSIMQVKDDGGNSYSALGYAKLSADRTMDIDIREDAFNRGLSASELPDVNSGDTLMVYFQVPIGTKLKSYVLGSKEQAFEETLVVGDRTKR